MAGPAFRQRNLKLGLVAFIDLLVYSARVKRIATTDELAALDHDLAFVQDQFEHNSTDELTRRETADAGSPLHAGARIETVRERVVEQMNQVAPSRRGAD